LANLARSGLDKFKLPFNKLKTESNIAITNFLSALLNIAFLIPFLEVARSCCLFILLIDELFLKELIFS